MNTIERHPFDPFLPGNAQILFLGSFPPQPKRWSMPFYYPNWLNDFWRVMGLLFFEDKDYFAVPGQKRFDQPRVEDFCRTQGFALYDTASAVRRLKDNASDKFLEVVQPSDLNALLSQIPACRTLVTTGQKATDVLVERFGCPEPPVGSRVEITLQEDMPHGSPALRRLSFWRMPSTSRAYPLSLEKKAAAYRRLFERSSFSNSSVQPPASSPCAGKDLL